MWIWLFSLVAVAAMLPALVASVGRDEMPGFWPLTVMACAGPLAWTLARQAPVWHTSFAAALWVAISVTLIAFAILALATPVARRLAPLLLAYLIAMGVLATLLDISAGRPLSGIVPPVWLLLHIALAVIAYGLMTLAAVAGVAVLLRAQALRSKQVVSRHSGLVRALPSVADSEALQGRLLRASFALLAAALVSGMATEWYARGVLLVADHKTILTLATLAAIALALILQRSGNVSGRRAASYVLSAYLLITLAYPGVKFVTDIVLR